MFIFRSVSSTLMKGGTFELHDFDSKKDQLKAVGELNVNSVLCKIFLNKLIKIHKVWKWFWVIKGGEIHPICPLKKTTLTTVEIIRSQQPLK